MKTSTAILFALVTLSLIISLITLLILVQNNIGLDLGSTSPNNTPLPTPEAFLSYNESIIEDLPNNQTRLVLSFNLTLFQGSSYTLNYSRLTVSPYVPRGGLEFTAMGMDYAHVSSQERGTVTVDGNVKTQFFQLTYYFPTYGVNFGGVRGHYTGYEIDNGMLFTGYSHQAVI